MTRPLIFIPSPRNLPEFNSATADIVNYDKYWVKYYEQELAYIRGRQYFLEHEEYTHLVILPDDLIVTQEQIGHLVHSSAKSDIVISGWCAVDKVHDDAAISEYAPPDPPATGRHEQFKFLKIPQIELLRNLNYSIVPIKFSGFALTTIPRDIVEQIPFRGSAGCCIDSCFALDLIKADIQQYVDLRIKTEHLKIEDSKKWYSNILTGKEKSLVRFEPAL